MRKRFVAACGAAWLLVLAGCGSTPKVSLDIESTPPGAHVSVIAGAHESAKTPPRELLIGPVTPTAHAGKPQEIGTTPLHHDLATDEQVSCYYLRVEHPDYEPYEFTVPASATEAHVSVGLVPKGALRDEDAVLALLLDRGPMTEEEMVAAAAAIPATRTAAALEWLRGKGMLDVPREKPPTFDLGEKGTARLRETLGEAAVIARLTRSRREMWRARKQ
jgi:hypothetical protein